MIKPCGVPISAFEQIFASQKTPSRSNELLKKTMKFEKEMGELLEHGVALGIVKKYEKRGKSSKAS